MNLRTFRAGQLRLFQLFSLVLLLSGFLIAIDQFPRGGDASAASSAQLRISPADHSVDAGASFSLAIVVNADVPIIGTEADFHFDPALVQVVSVTKGASFPASASFTAGVAPQTVAQAIASANTTGDLLNLSVFFISGTPVPAGTATAFNISMQAKPGVTGISALTLSGQSVLEVGGFEVANTTTVGGAIMVGSAATNTPTETPTPSETAIPGTPTPTNTSIPGATSTSTFTATATPTPTSTHTATHTPTLIPTATPTPSPTPTMTATATATNTATATATSTATSTPEPVATVRIKPAAQTVAPSATFTVTIEQSTAVESIGVEVDFEFDEARLQIDSVARGAAYGAGSELVAGVSPQTLEEAIDEANTTGTLKNLAVYLAPGTSTVASGDRHAFTITLHAWADGNTSMALSGAALLDAVGLELPTAVDGIASVEVAGSGTATPTPSSPTPTSSVTTGGPVLKIAPATQEVEASKTFTVTIRQNAGVVSTGIEVDFEFDQGFMSIQSVAKGSAYGAAAVLEAGFGASTIEDAITEANDSGKLHDLTAYYVPGGTTVPAGEQQALIITLKAGGAAGVADPLDQVEGGIDGFNLSEDGIFVLGTAGQKVAATEEGNASVTVFTVPTETPTLAAGAPMVKLSPATQDVPPNGAFSVNVVLNANFAAKGLEVDFAFDKSLVELVTFAKGSVLGEGSSFLYGVANTAGVRPTLAQAITEANTTGTLLNLGSYYPAEGGSTIPIGDQTAFTLSLKAKSGAAAGSSALTLSGSAVLDARGAVVPSGTQGGAVVILAGADATVTPTPTATATGTPTGTATVSATATVQAAATQLSAVAPATANPSGVQPTALPNSGNKEDVNRFLLALAVVLAAAGSSGLTASAMIRREMK